ncbi:Protein of unknown function DUF2506 [Flexistipes sinusarabici DSM 4947]|uniref:DUF2628 domain-containing protein n=2 Tax=Flexistipes sinusarabici TaxID=2352 RepID=F8E905_FLESM|nr:Protein of unknown function DUF2506 [Flexistipes sinusarabici DSM 4947]
MKQYKIYANPQGNYEAVKQGWSWPAFFFSFIWAMVKKMWGLGVGVLIAFLVLGFIIGASGSGSGGDALIRVASIIVKIIFGVNGNKWRESNLPKRGYEYKETVAAANPEGAVALYMKENSEG